MPTGGPRRQELTCRAYVQYGTRPIIKGMGEHFSFSLRPACIAPQVFVRLSMFPFWKAFELAV